MAVQLHELELHLSGGAVNANPNLSLGGIISATKVLSQNSTATTNVTGVTIVDSIGNALGNGTLNFTLTGSLLQWTPLGGTIGTGVAVTVDGRYTIQSGGIGYIVVDIIAANLAIANAVDANIAITNNKNGIFDDVLKAQSFAGSIEYRCLYMKNTSAIDTAFDVILWVAAQPTGVDNLALMIDAAGGGNGSTTGVAQVIVNEGTVPATGVFSSPLISATGISLGQLAPNQSAAFWIKRNVPALNITTTLGDVSSIGFKAFV